MKNLNLLALAVICIFSSFAVNGQTIKIDGVESTEIESATFYFDIQGGLTGYWINHSDGKILRASKELDNLVSQSYMKRGWVELKYPADANTAGHSFSVPRPKKTVKLGSTDFGFPELHIGRDGLPYWEVEAEGENGNIVVQWNEDSDIVSVQDQRFNPDAEFEEMPLSDLPEGWRFVDF